VPDAARGVVYHVDARAGTATLVWQYRTPDDRQSAGTGSFRRYGAGRTTYSHGAGIPKFFTEVDAKGKDFLEAAFTNGEAAHRNLKAPIGEFDHDLLRRSAGLPAASFNPPPHVLSVGPARGPSTGGTSVTITGTGFTGATAVKFGAANAMGFTVLSDDAVAAVAPAGFGSAAVSVTTPRGKSAPGAHEILSRSDAKFSTGTRSWAQNVDATVDLSKGDHALATVCARSPPEEARVLLRPHLAIRRAGQCGPGSSVWATAARGPARARCG
jgi:IPT/TIG domain